MKSNRTEELIRIFEDTRDWYEQDAALRRSVQSSIAGTVFYPASISPALGTPRYFQPMSVSVSCRRTLEAALCYLQEKPDANVTILNFASATHPGGGVTRGRSTQEEAICRCSTLYPTLCTWELRRKFYELHRNRRDLRYTDACIYTPGIMVIKTDTDLPERMSQWRQVNVITCAAPNLREYLCGAVNPGRGGTVKLSDTELQDLHRVRGEKILRVAAAQETDILILGTFGCGAFRNPPEVVARAYREILDQFDGYLYQVEFAVYCPPHDSRNYEAFRIAMQ